MLIGARCSERMPGFLLPERFYSGSRLLLQFRSSGTVMPCSPWADPRQLRHLTRRHCLSPGWVPLHGNGLSQASSGRSWRSGSLSLERANAASLRAPIPPFGGSSSEIGGRWAWILQTKCFAFAFGLLCIGFCGTPVRVRCALAYPFACAFAWRDRDCRCRGEGGRPDPKLGAPSLSRGHRLNRGSDDLW